MSLIFVINKPERNICSIVYTVIIFFLFIIKVWFLTYNPILLIDYYINNNIVVRKSKNYTIK